MKERIDGYLSRKVQNFDPTALVICQYLEAEKEEWVLRRTGHEELGLGDGFGAAKSAVIAFLRAERQKAKA